MSKDVTDTSEKTVVSCISIPKVPAFALQSKNLNVAREKDSVNLF